MFYLRRVSVPGSLNYDFESLDLVCIDQNQPSWLSVPMSVQNGFSEVVYDVSVVRIIVGAERHIYAHLRKCLNVLLQSSHRRIVDSSGESSLPGGRNVGHDVVSD